MAWGVDYSERAYPCTFLKKNVYWRDDQVWMAVEGVHTVQRFVFANCEQGSGVCFVHCLQGSNVVEMGMCKYDVGQRARKVLPYGLGIVSRIDHSAEPSVWGFVLDYVAIGLKRTHADAFSSHPFPCCSSS